MMKNAETFSREPKGATNGQSFAGSESKAYANGCASHGRDSRQELGSTLKRLWEQTVVPVLIMSLTPNVIILIWFAAVQCDGSYACVGKVFQEKSLIGGMGHMWSQVTMPSPAVIWILVSYTVFALTLMRLVPGRVFYGPLTPNGNRPQYKDNGFACFIITITTFWFLTAICKTRFSVSPTIIYDRFDEVLLLLNVFSIFFCLLLYVKGLVAPSSSDSGSSGNVIFDYYWGMELHPQILGYDVKVFTNCRFGMTVWALLVCIFALKSYELHGPVDSMLVSALLQMVYFAKFFWWEAGYMCTIDIMMDRAGYYICWGCLVWVPGFYSSVSLFQVNHPIILGLPVSFLILSLGLLSIYINYDADRQKLVVRHNNGNCLVWGQKPRIIRAKYRLENGDSRESILLVSGWWGLARHFHYVPEILLSFFWALPSLFQCFMPYTYTFYLIVLLLHRSFRDDTRCELKYGKFWAQYRKEVPHRVLPYIF